MAEQSGPASKATLNGGCNCLVLFGRSLEAETTVLFALDSSRVNCH
jgi:hypothetical protein